MSREILDIYHMTRKKKNSELYILLPQSYRQILYQLHSTYIDQKNNIETSDIKEMEFELSDDSDNKVSISVDNVYTKLKELDTSLLIDLYKDREELVINIENMVDDEIKNPIKDCINTQIQTTLLRSNRPV
jgi:hypothetical protein